MEKLPALHAAVMAACADQNGIIMDPRACTFDPASTRCSAGLDQPSCLTDAQIRVVRDEYRINPFDPMQPAPNNEGLNSNYRYLFEASVYKPGAALWCSDRGHPLICSRR